jgi:hypothetical protein
MTFPSAVFDGTHLLNLNFCPKIKLMEAENYAFSDVILNHLAHFFSDGEML